MCMDETWDECINLSIMEAWKGKLTLKTLNNWKRFKQCEDLAHLLDVGNHFSVLRFPTNEDFEDDSVVCMLANTILKEFVTDGWGDLLNIGEGSQSFIMQKRSCIIKRCTLFDNLCWWHYLTQVQYGSSKEESWGIQQCL